MGGGACLIQQDDCHGSDATKCVEGESPLGSGGVSWCCGFVSVVDVYELAKRATRDRYKQGDRARRREFLEYATDVANELLHAYSPYGGIASSRRREPARPVGLDYLTPFPKNVTGSSMGGVIRGMAGNAPPPAAAYNSSSDASSEIERQVIRTGSLEIIAGDTLQAAEQLRNLAAHFSGFVVSSNVSGSDEGTRSAQVSMRIPAEYFDEARAQVRKIAKTVERDTIEAHDVTRESVNQEATLRNARAEEAQYCPF